MSAKHQRLQQAVGIDRYLTYTYNLAIFFFKQLKPLKKLKTPRILDNDGSRTRGAALFVILLQTRGKR